MGRYRPPLPAASPYISKQGFETLELELKQLWSKRALVTEALAAAAAEGDRSENAEYIYRKKELREIDRRIRYLQKRIPLLKIVSEHPDNSTKVYFGAWIELEDDNGNKFTYRIVGSDEINLKKGWISIDSPMSKSLLNKSLGDDIIVATPNGDVCYCIDTISYKAVQE